MKTKNIKTVKPTPDDSSAKQNRGSEFTGTIPKHLQVLENQDAAIHIIDTDMRIVFINSYFRSWCEQLEIDLPKKPLGKPLFSLFPFLEPKIRREYDQVYRSGKKLTMEEKLHIRNETYIVRTEKVPLFIQDQVDEIVTIITDFTAEKRALRELRDSEAYLKALFDYAPIAYYLTDQKGTFIDGNLAAEKLIGFSKQELIGKNYLQTKLLPPNQFPLAAKILGELILGESSGPYEVALKHKDGKEILIDVRNIEVRLRNKSRILGIAQDITERKKSEAREQRYTHDMKFLSDSAMRFVEHPREEDIFPLIGEQLAALIPESIVIVTAYHEETMEAEVKAIAGLGNRIKEVNKILGRKAQGMRTVLDTESARERLYRGKLVKVEGGLHEISFSKLPLSVCRVLEKTFGIKAFYSIGFTHKGILFGAAAIILRKESELKNRSVIEAFINQTAVALQRWNAEKKIAASLKEKEVLLREIHHRVKNNMQIISSLLRLQSRIYEDESIRSLFQSSQDRIKSMALIHESLYRSSDLAQIDFHKYVSSLATHLRYLYKEGAGNITLDIDVANTLLDINQAVPLGLILNELISNALKHAFPHNSGGRIRIRMQPEKEKTYQLTVSDNGIGFPGKLDFRNTDSLGMQLVTDLTRQIRGALRMENDAGTRFTILFPQGD